MGACLILLLVALAGCAPAQDPYHKKIAKLSVLEQGENHAALDRIASLSAEDLTAKGDAYFAHGSLELARLHYSAALQKEPEAITPLTGLGRVFLARGNTLRARDIFNAVLEKDPQNAIAMLGLARIARDQGSYQTAEAYLETLYAAHPDDPEVISELAITYDSIGQDKLLKAEPLHQKFVELQPERAAGYNNLGFNYLLQGRYGEAIPMFSKALTIAPNDLRAKNNLATAYLLNNEELRALQLFENTLGKPAAYNNIGYLYMTQGNWDEAEKAFKKALELNPVFYMRAQQNLERLNRLRSQQTP